MGEAQILVAPPGPAKAPPGPTLPTHARFAALPVDALTGLASRDQFEQELAAALAGPEVMPGTVGVVLLDLERFKAINTSLGLRHRRHGAGGGVRAVERHRRRRRPHRPVGGRRVPGPVPESCRQCARPCRGLRRAGPAGPGDPVRDRRGGDLPRRVGRHGAEHLRHRRRRVAAGQRRIRHVPGQEPRREDRRDLRRVHADRAARPDDHGALPAPGARAQRIDAPLPTGGGADRGDDGERRGAGPLAASPTWAGGALPVHPGGRGERAHHPHRGLGARTGLSSAA